MTNPNQLVKGRCERCGSKTIALDEDRKPVCVLCGRAAKGTPINGR